MDNDRNEVQGNHWGIKDEEESDPSVEPQELDEPDTSTTGGDMSEVVGIILMLAVTVILAAVIGTFALDPYDNLSETESPMPQVEVDETPKQITLTISEIPADYDHITVEGPNKQVRVVSDRQVVFENPPKNPNITVTGTYTEVTSGAYSSQEETTTILLYDSQTGNQS